MLSKIQKILTGDSQRVYKKTLGGLSGYAKPPHRFIAAAWEVYTGAYPNNPSVNGRVFEWLVCECLAREGVAPFYYQGRFERIPNAEFDVVCYERNRPVVLSMKVSLRERYKQADLEGMALRQVYRNAECYLLTLSGGETPRVNKKIKSGDIAGLNKCIVASEKEFSELLKELASRQFTSAEAVRPLTGVQYP